MLTRDGAPLVDPRPAPSRYGSVARQIEARAALRQLGYKAHAAKHAIERACAHVDADADVAALVSKVLELDRVNTSWQSWHGSCFDIALCFSLCF